MARTSPALSTASLPDDPDDSGASSEPEGPANSSGRIARAPLPYGSRLRSFASRASGPLLLTLAAFLWATPAPAMRYLFLHEGGPTPSVLMTIQGLAAGLFMLAASALFSRRAAAGSSPASARAAPEEPAARSVHGEDGALAASSSSAATVPAAAAQSAAALALEAPVSRGAVLARARAVVRWALGAETSDVRLAGLELGFIGFLANSFVTLGFQYTPATRGSLLTRTSVVFTTLLAAAAGERLRAVVWAGTALACVGGALVSADGAPGASATATSLGGGDALIVVGALLWGIHTVRMGRHAPRFPALRLTALQVLTMGAFSSLWLASDVIAALADGLGAAAVWPGWRDATSWGVLLLPAVASWGIASALQVSAQSRVPPSQTQIIYGTIPLWTLLMARQMGGGEGRLGLFGWLGGGALLLAVVATSAGSARSAESEGL